jgi:hypothetical protein
MRETHAFKVKGNGQFVQNQSKSALAQAMLIFVL